MYKCISRYLVTISLIAVAISVSAIEKPQSDFLWLKQQLVKHPQVLAARQSMKANLYQAESLEKATYNPQLSTDLGNEGSDRTYSLGINQTIDWTNKRASRKQQAVFARISAQKSYALVVQTKMAEALNALINWQAIKDQSQLITKQENQLENLLEIVKKRTKNGDLGQLDAELAYLSLSQRFGESARVQAQLRRIEASIGELIPDWNKRKIALSQSQWSNVIEEIAEELVDNHPAVQVAKAQWEISVFAAEIALKNKKADPTIGLGAGKLGRDDVLTLSLSFPLYVRNNFSLQYKAADQQAMASEANYHAVRRKQLFAIKASKAALKEYNRRFQKWQNLMQGRDKNSGNLLQKQWSIGDISTTEYLLTLQQRTAGLIAGIQLEQEYQSALIQLLLDTAQLTNGDNQ